VRVRVRYLSFRVQWVGCRVWSLGFGVRIKELRVGSKGLELRV
jgi:hypothetical protein